MVAHRKQSYTKTAPLRCLLDNMSKLFENKIQDEQTNGKIYSLKEMLEILQMYVKKLESLREKDKKIKAKKNRNAHVPAEEECDDSKEDWFPAAAVDVDVNVADEFDSWKEDLEFEFLSNWYDYFHYFDSEDEYTDREERTFDPDILKNKSFMISNDVQSINRILSIILNDRYPDDHWLKDVFVHKYIIECMTSNDEVFEKVTAENFQKILSFTNVVLKKPLLEAILEKIISIQKLAINDEQAQRNYLNSNLSKTVQEHIIPDKNSEQFEDFKEDVAKIVDFHIHALRLVPKNIFEDLNASSEIFLTEATWRAEKRIHTLSLQKNV